MRVIDRRMTTDHVGRIDLPDVAEKATVKQYKPYTIGTQPHKITSIQFNSVGSELLVSYSEDYVYLFSNRLFHAGPLPRDPRTRDGSASLSRPTYLSQLESYSPGRRIKKSSLVKRKPSPSYYDSPPTSSSTKPALKGNSVPPAKKLRLRGDWSDTGPEARPEVDSEGRGNGGGREGGPLMSRMSRMFAQWIDMSLSPNSNNESNLEEAPGRYRSRRNRRVPHPPSHRDRASSSTSPATSSSDSFQLFDSDSNETEIEEGGERGSGRVQEGDNSTTLDSKEEAFPLTIEYPNGSTVRSEGVATTDVSTTSERSIVPPSRASGDLETIVSFSSVERQSAGERDAVARLTLSDGHKEKSSDSKNSFRTRNAKDVTTSLRESGEDGIHTCSTRDLHGSAASNVEVTIENRTKNSSPDSAPAVVVEGETDSDDTYEEDGSCDESRDCWKRSHDDGTDGLLSSEYFMRYKGHRNSRTMVCAHEILCMVSPTLSLSPPLAVSLSLSHRSSRLTFGERIGYSVVVTVVVCLFGTSGVVRSSTCSWLTLMLSTVFNLIPVLMVWHTCIVYPLS